MPASTTGAPYRDVTAARRLAAPPREVPARLRLVLRFGGVVAVLGWFMFGVGSVVAWAVGATTDFSRLTVHGPIDRVDGVVTHTDVKVSRNHHLFTVHFVFDDAAGRHLGTSYSSETLPPDGWNVTVDVPRGRPDRAVVVGMRRAPVPLGVFLLVVIVPLGSLGLALFRAIAAGREIHLLERGLLGHGRLVHRETTRMHVNNRPVEKLSFDFEDARGRVHRTIVRTHRPERVTDEALEPLVYDPRDPTRAALLDALPGAPRVDDAGRIGFDGSPWTLLSALGLPLLAVLVNLAAAAFVL